MNSNGNFQQTEIGFFPADWQIQKLGDLVQNGRTIRYGVVQPGDFVSDGCIMLRSQDYSKGWAKPAAAYRISNAIANQYRNAQLKENDLILTVVGANTGQVAVAPRWLDGAVLSRSTSRIAVDADQVDSRFCKFVLQSPTVQRQILDNLKEGAQPVISCQDVADFLVPVPPKKEQRAIAEALSDVDALINALDALITKKRHIKQGTMQQLLTGKKRLPGFSGDWEETSIAGVVEFLDGMRKPIKTSDRAHMQGKYPYYGASGVIDHVNDFIFDEELILLGEDGENILSRNSPLAFQVSGKIWVNNHAHVLRPKVGNDISFLTAYLESLDYEEYNTGTAQPKLNKRVCSAIPIQVPKLAEQNAIGIILTDMDAEITALEQKRDKTKLIKQGMMQVLLTGQVRLTTIDNG